MKIIFRNLIALSFLFGILIFAVPTTYAYEIEVTDEYGNVEILYSGDDEALKSEPISLFSTDTYFDAPHPDTLTGWLNYLCSESVFTNWDNFSEDMVLPNYANFFFFDFGPNWNSGENTYNDGAIPGRYLYLFYGRVVAYTDSDDSLKYGIGAGDFIEPEFGSAAYSFESGVDDDPFTPDDNVFSVHGPFALLFYDPESNTTFLQEFSYNKQTGYARSCTITGLTSIVDSTNIDYYPKLSSFMNDMEERIECWNWNLWLMSSYNIHNVFWNGAVSDFDTTLDKDDDGFWDAIEDGNWTGSGFNGFLGNALQGVTYVIEFVQNAPVYFDAAANALPEPLAVFLICCFSLIVSIIIFKLALQFIRG